LAAVPTRYQKRVYKERVRVMSFREYYEYEKNYVELPTDINGKVEKIMDLVDSIEDMAGQELTIRLLHRLLNKRPLTCCHNDQNEWILDDSLTDMPRNKAVYRHRRYDSLAMVVDGRDIKFVDLDYNMIWDSDSDTARSFLGGAREVEMPYRVPREPNLYEEHKFTNGIVKRERYEL
jgi:hypothetical protein